MSDRPRAGGITRRAVALGLLLTLAHTVWLVFEELTLSHIGTPSIFTLVQTVVGILFVLMLINGRLRRRRPAWALRPGELMVVFVMTTFGAILTSVKLLHYLFPTLLWPAHVPEQAGGPATAASLPAILAPKDPALVRAFFAGTRDLGAFFRPHVWQAWLGPMLFWGAFFLLLLWTMLCLASVVRRPWLEQERVPFPMVDLPVMLARAGGADTLFGDRLLALGFWLTSALLSVNYVSSMIPAVPGVKLSEVDVALGLTAPPWSSVAPMLTVWWPYAVGLCYLIPLDVSFSCWFFYAAVRLMAVAATALGWRDAGSVQDLNQFPHFGDAAQGAFVGMFLVILWNARGFLRGLARAIRRREPVPGDAEEAIAYRPALAGAMLGYVLLVVLGVVAGLRPAVSMLAFALYFLAIVVMARMYAQIAMPLFCMAFFSVAEWTAGIVGTARLTRGEAATLTTFTWFDRTYEQIPMGHHLEAFAFADRLRASRRAMLKVVLLTSVVSIAVGMVTLLALFYDRGAATARVSGDSAWLAGFAWSRFAGWMGNPREFEVAPLLRGCGSAALVLALTYARGVWIGCPLHPIGYLFTTSFALEWGMWNVIFATWLVKALVVRYGGLRLYRTSVAFFYGLALGDCVTHFVWGVGLSLAGARGASPYL